MHHYIVALLSLIVHVYGSKLPLQITLDATVRTFISGHCMSNDDKTLYNKAGKDGQRAENRDQSGCYTIDSSGNNVEIDINGEQIQLIAHPDFEASNVKSTKNIPKVDIDLSSPSGIPKPRYCSDSTIANVTDSNSIKDHLCGILGDENNYYSTTSGKDRFDQWYRDTLYVNKRTSSQLLLNRTEDGNYLYDSAESSPEALINDGSGTDKRKGYFGPLDNVPDSLNPYAANTRWPLIKNIENKFLTPPGEPLGRFLLEHKFWFTTEIHTYFQYKGNGEIFKFSGDDDVFVYINGKLEMDLGGVHSPEDADLTLSNLKYSVLEVGKVYTLDLYHAERHTYGSNFRLTSSLTAACNVENSPKSTLTRLEIANNFNQFANEFKLFGSSIESDKLYLSKSNQMYSYSHAWLKKPVNIGRGFNIEFTYSISKSNVVGEGFTFTFQNDGITDLSGGTEGNFGLYGIDKRVSFEMDFCSKRNEAGLSDEAKCTDALQFRIVVNGEVVAYDDVFYRVADGEYHKVTIRYLETPDWIEVLHDGSLWLRKTDFNISSILGDGAYAGLTSSSSSVSADIIISDLEISTVGIESKNTVIDLDMVKSPTYDNSTMGVLPVADGIDFTSVKLENFDFCLERIEFGGNSDLIDAKLIEVIGTAYNYNDVEEWTKPIEGRTLMDLNPEEFYYNYSTTPNNISATIIDMADGTYELRFSASIAAEYSLEVTFDGEPACFTNDNKELLCSPFDNVAAFQAFEPISTGVPTMVPTEQPDTGLSEELGLILAISGGALGASLICFTCCCMRYQSEWSKKFKFIGIGKATFRDKDVAYADEDLTNLMKEYQRSQEEIRRLQAHDGGTEDYSKEIAEMELQQSEIREQLQAIKKRNQQNKDNRKSFFPRFSKQITKRKTWGREEILSVDSKQQDFIDV